jgi:hypothetical protein
VAESLKGGVVTTLVAAENSGGEAVRMLAAEENSEGGAVNLGAEAAPTLGAVDSKAAEGRRGGGAHQGAEAGEAVGLMRTRERRSEQRSAVVKKPSSWAWLGSSLKSLKSGATWEDGGQADQRVSFKRHFDSRHHSSDPCRAAVLPLSTCEKCKVLRLS